MKRRFMFIFVTMMMLSSFCLFNSTSVSAKQQTPKLSSTKISLETGSKKTLKIKKLSKNAKISWKSNNSKIVKVSKKGIVSYANRAAEAYKSTMPVGMQESKRVQLHFIDGGGHMFSKKHDVIAMKLLKEFAAKHE